MYIVYWFIQEAQVGLNFASEDEAYRFKEAVEKKLVDRHIRAIGNVPYTSFGYI